MKNDEYYKKITSLFLPYQVDADAIDKGINKYIDLIDAETERLERSYNSQNMPQFCDVLANIQMLLDAICAKRHEAYTVTLTRSSRNGFNEYSNKVLQQAIADFLLLSIEMQKAQSLSDSDYKSSAVEMEEESARNLSAVVQLLDAEDYDRAKALLDDLSSRGMNVRNILAMMSNGSYAKAKELSVALQNSFSDKINEVSKDSKSKTVLAVDDRPEILTTVNSALSTHYRTLCAPSGRVALDILNQQDIGIFILDIDMPDMDGFQLAQQIRNNKKYKETPIIYLTGNSSRERIQKAVRIGISDFIVKPAYNETLLTKVKKHLK
jgi:PleD family two-component response regulator